MHDGEHAIDKNKRKIFTSVSSVAEDPCTKTDEQVRKSCAGSQSESSSGSIPTENLSSFITRCFFCREKRANKNNVKTLMMLRYIAKVIVFCLT